MKKLINNANLPKPGALKKALAGYEDTTSIDIDLESYGVARYILQKMTKLQKVSLLEKYR